MAYGVKRKKNRKNDNNKKQKQSKTKQKNKTKKQNKTNKHLRFVLKIMQIRKISFGKLRNMNKNFGYFDIHLSNNTDCAKLSSFDVRNYTLQV